MLVVKVELYSAVTGSQTELARMVIDNVGGTLTLGDYNVRTMRGRSKKSLDASMRAILQGQARPVKSGKVNAHPRLREHVWNLVAKGLFSMGYGQ